MKYVDTLVTCSEVPDEISLCINISNCPYHCPGCHSSYLAQDIGTELTKDTLIELIVRNPGISCVCLMGGQEQEVLKLLHEANLVNLVNIRVAWYTGQKELPGYPLLKHLDYVKVGPYIDELGPLTSKTTNQRFYKILYSFSPEFRAGQDVAVPAVTLHDITSEFWKEKDV